MIRSGFHLKALVSFTLARHIAEHTHLSSGCFCSNTTTKITTGVLKYSSQSLNVSQKHRAASTTTLVGSW